MKPNKLIGHRLRKAARKIYKEKDPAWSLSYLPWRMDNDPYKIFVAEFMLVRTRFAAVETVFEKFIKKFPSIESIIKASRKELEITLGPLGLNKRVDQLREAALQLSEIHDGNIPGDFSSLIEIKGIGEYVANAILAFGFRQKVVPADVNILRFVARYCGLEMVHKSKGSEEIRALLPELVRYQRNYSPEKLIDFTTQICKPRKPLCPICPVSNKCMFPVN